MDALGVSGLGPAGLRPATDLNHLSVGHQSPDPACPGSAETPEVAWVKPPPSTDGG